MTSIVLKMPMFRRDSNSQWKRIYALYKGYECLVTEDEKSKYKTIRLLAVENRRGKWYLFRLAGNGTYGLYGRGHDWNAKIAWGSMRDPMVPEIGPR